MEITASVVNSYNPPGPTVVHIKIPATFTGKCGPTGTGEFFSGVTPGAQGTAMLDIWSTDPRAESWSFSAGGAWLSCNREDLELHDPDTYTPGPRDSILFPGAPSHWNRKHAYVVTALDGDTMSYVAETDVDAEPYTLTLERARAMGMTPARTCDDCGAQPGEECTWGCSSNWK